jgi:hypothetical protein
MMYATKIHMQQGCENSQNLLEIESVYVEGCNNPGLFSKGVLYDHLKANPGTIKVNVAPYPDVIPELSIYKEKYVKSTPNATQRDNLLSLPRV